MLEDDRFDNISWDFSSDSVSDESFFLCYFAQRPNNRGLPQLIAIIGIWNCVSKEILTSQANSNTVKPRLLSFHVILGAAVI